MTGKKVLSLFLLSFFIFLLLSHSVLAAKDPIPKPVGDIYVQDFADVLNPEEERQLSALGRQIDDSTSNQIAVLTVDTTSGLDMEEFSNRAFRSFGLGTKEKDNGILLVLALKERQIRIEVGYGLEGTIPDGKAGRILDEYALPHLQAGKPNLAIVHTYQALAQSVSGEGESAAPAGQDEGGGIPAWLLIIIVAVVVYLDIKYFGGALSYTILSMLSRGGGRGGGGGPRSGGGGSSSGGGAGRGW